MKHFFILYYLFVSSIVFALSKTDANLIGDVKDKNSGAHIPFINVTINNTVIGTNTDHTGHYFLKNLPEGTFTVRVSGVGYKTVEQQVQLIAGKTVELNFLTEETALSLDEVVISANRNETNRRDASVIVGVLNSKLFLATNAVCMADGLNYQPGVRVETDCGNCGFTQVRINGLGGQYSQILIDSRPVFSALAGVYGLEQIPVNMIERVEVLRGGGSALYGSSAIAGTINIITKEALNNGYSAAYNFQQTGNAPDHSVNLNTSIVTDDSKAGMYLYGTYRNRSPFDYNADGFSEMPQLLQQTIGMRSYYRLSSQSKLTLQYHSINEFRRGGNKFDLQPHQSDIAEQLEHSINGGSLAYNWFSSNSKHKLNAYTSLQNIKRKSYYGAGMDLNAYGRANNNTAVIGSQYVSSFDQLFFMPAEFTTGLEYQYDYIDDKIPGYNRDLVQSTKTAGVFFQNEWKNTKMNILIGGRLDKHNLLNKAIFSPRINLKYNFSKNLNWRSSYAAGFRAPQAFDEDLHLEAVGGTVRMIEINSNLQPEFSHTFSTSFDYYFNIGTVQTNVLLDGFSTRINDIFILIEKGLNADNVLVMERTNGSGARVSGVNFEARIIPNQKIQLQLGYTLQQSLFDEAEHWSDDVNVPAQRRMLRTPGDYGFFNFSYNPTKRFQVNATGTYTGSMLAPHYTGFIANDKLEITPQFLDLNLKVSYDVKINGISAQISGGAKNLLNSYQTDLDEGIYKDGGYIYGPSISRSFFVGLKFGNLF